MPETPNKSEKTPDRIAQQSSRKVRRKNAAEVFEHVAAFWDDDEELDLRGDHRGSLTIASAIMKHSQSIDKLREELVEIRYAIEVYFGREPE